MQLLLPVIAIVIIAAISLFGGKKNPTAQKKNNPTPTPTISAVSETPTPTSNKADVTITIKNQTENSPTPTPQPQTNNSDLNNFVYPGSTTVSNPDGTISLTSTDDPNAITDWYKSKIKSEGMNTTSFVVTNTNGNVNNVLAGAGGNNQIKITITKSSGDSTVNITVSPKSS